MRLEIDKLISQASTCRLGPRCIDERWWVVGARSQSFFVRADAHALHTMHTHRVGWSAIVLALQLYCTVWWRGAALAEATARSIHGMQHALQALTSTAAGPESSAT